MTIHKELPEKTPDTTAQQPAQEPSNETGAVVVKAVRTKLASLIPTNSETTKPPFEFKRLWMRDGTLLDYEAGKHNFHPQTLPMECPEQTNYSAAVSYQRIEWRLLW